MFMVLFPNGAKIIGTIHTKRKELNDHFNPIQINELFEVVHGLLMVPQQLRTIVHTLMKRKKVME